MYIVSIIHIILSDKFNLYLCKQARWTESCTVIGYLSGQDEALLYGYNSTRALIGCWAGIIFL